MMNKYPRGSEWLKWDLHIHSNASDGKGSPEQIIEEAKRKGLDVIALTDHHTAKNIDEIKELGKQSEITVISGVEFKSDSGSKSVHLIGLFPDKNENIELNSKAIHDLILSPLGFSETKIIAKGKEDDSTLNNELAFRAGMHKVCANIENIANMIHKYGGLVLIHAGCKTNSIEGLKHFGKSDNNVHELYECLGVKKKELFTEGLIDICEISPNEKDATFYLDEFNRASIHASDAHEISDIGTRFTWLKANPTFEGLKQVVFEPTERVYRGTLKPESKPDYQVIDQLNIKHHDFHLNDLKFNQNLNVIIGGRSSGKSLLLGVIAKKTNNLVKVKKDSPFYETYINDIVEKAELLWMDGDENIDRDLEYFSQSYINGLVAKEERTKELIEEIIKRDVSKKNILDNYKNYCIEVQSELNKAISRLFVIRGKYIQLLQEIKIRGNKNGIEKEIEKISLEIEKIKSEIEQDGLEDVIKKHSEFEDSIKKMKNKCKEYEEINRELEEIKNKDLLIDIKNFYISDFVQLLVEDAFNTIKVKANKEWTEKIQSFINKNNYEAEIKKDSVYKLELEPEYIKCKRFFESNETYIALEKLLQSEKNKINEIEKLDQEVNSFSEKLMETRDLLLKIHLKYFEEANKVTAMLGIEIDDIQISPKIIFCEKKFNDILSSKFNQKYRETQEIIPFKYENSEKYKTFLEKNIISNILDDKAYLKNSVNAQQALTDILVENYFEIFYDIIYQNDSLSLMSEGKKAFIILRLLLDYNNKKCPILIDQPEDDLDNRSISNELVNYIKQTKKERQIILVTHNPNIVVGADAEEVIVANQNGNNSPNNNGRKFSYISGAIEDSCINNNTEYILESKGIREHICEILEGGDEAFMKRELKYGFNNKK